MFAGAVHNGTVAGVAGGLSSSPNWRGMRAALAGAALVAVWCSQDMPSSMLSEGRAPGPEFDKSVSSLVDDFGEVPRATSAPPHLELQAEGRWSMVRHHTLFRFVGQACRPPGPTALPPEASTGWAYFQRACAPADSWLSLCPQHGAVSGPGGSDGRWTPTDGYADIRCDEDYEAFYRAQLNAGRRLPPPLQLENYSELPLHLAQQQVAQQHQQQQQQHQQQQLMAARLGHAGAGMQHSGACAAPAPCTAPPARTHICSILEHAWRAHA